MSLPLLPVAFYPIIITLSRKMSMLSAGMFVKFYISRMRRDSRHAPEPYFALVSR
jgi:hypothetical protein